MCSFKLVALCIAQETLSELFEALLALIRFKLRKKKQTNEQTRKKYEFSCLGPEFTVIILRIDHSQPSSERGAVVDLVTNLFPFLPKIMLKIYLLAYYKNNMIYIIK